MNRWASETLAAIWPLHSTVSKQTCDFMILLAQVLSTSPVQPTARQYPTC